ncbi:MAG TPA: sulfatase [Acidimicrobiales bacterium]|nr:sulfatase [Acidimicrobiales bacterium]
MPPEPPIAPAAPRNAVVVLLDSLNRSAVGAYGGTEVETPNLDRLARRSVRFDDHRAGSLPCIPARHDLLVGALDFPWRPWGSIEVWESSIVASLRAAGVATMLVSDHPHLFETGGENYHTDFRAWDYQRGHESDPWRTRPDPSFLGAPVAGERWHPYDDSRTWFRGEEDFPGPRTLASAATWLRRDAPHHDRFFLLVDEFDPHEPFDVPEPYASMYGQSAEDRSIVWPPYSPGRPGVVDDAQARALRSNYAAKVTMIDAWLGRILDALDETGRWDDTVVVLCTDHGHYLGERDIWGKPAVPVYETMGRLPLLVAWPGVAAGSCGALTATVDLHATLCDVFGVSPGHPTHGRSLGPLVRGQAGSVRDEVLAGVWGREVHLVTPGSKYVRAPVGPNAPLSMWSNRWSTMPVPDVPELRLPLPDERAVLDRAPGTKVPVIRQPFAEGDLLPYWAWGGFSGHHLWALSEDPGEEHDLAGHGTKAEAEAVDHLREALRAVAAPDDQYVRLGLT